MSTSKHINLFFDKTINLYTKNIKKKDPYLKFKNTMKIKFSLEVSFLTNILLKTSP